MEAVWPIVGVLSLVAVPVGLVMLIFKKTRQRGKWTAGVAFLLFVVCMIMTPSDKAAKDAGFKSNADMAAAQKANITDPKLWEEVKAKTAQEQAEAKAKAEQVKTEARARYAELTRQPDDQATLSRIVTEAKQLFSSAETDMQRGASRPYRARKLCNSLGSRSVSGWVGKVTTLSTNSEGKGVLKISFDDTAVGTWNNALSDLGTRTLVEPGTSVYTQMLALKNGDMVKFSGTLFQSDLDCIQEQSVTIAGSIKDPEFTMRFSSINKITAP